MSVNIYRKLFSNGQKKMALLLFLALRTDAEKVELMVNNPVARGFGNLSRELVNQAKFRIDDGFAGGADQVRMGIGFVAVVAITAGSTADLQDLADLCEQMHGFVDCRQAGGGEVAFDLLVNLLDAGMGLAVQEDFEDGHPLRSDATTPFAKLGNNRIESIRRGLHGRTVRKNHPLR